MVNVKILSQIIILSLDYWPQFREGALWLPSQGWISDDLCERAIAPKNKTMVFVKRHILLNQKELSGSDVKLILHFTSNQFSTVHTP